MRAARLALVPLALLTACAAARSPRDTARGNARAPAGPALEQLFSVHRAFGVAPAPQDRALAFLSDAPGLAQAYVVPLGAEALAAPLPEARWTRRTRFEERVQLVRYTPDGRYLFFGRDRGGDENTQLLRALADAPASEPEDLTAAPTVKHLFGALSPDGRFVAYASNARNGRDFDLYLRAVDGATPPRRVHEAAGHNEAVSFSPDGALLYVSHERSNFDNDLLRVELATGRATQLTPAPSATQPPARYYFARAARDGSLLLASDQGRDFVNTARLAPDGALRYLFDEPHDVDQQELSHDGRTLAVAYNVDGWSDLRLFDVSDPSQPRPGPRVALERAVVTSMEFSAGGATLALTVSRATSPDEVYAVDTRSGSVTRVTASDHAGLDEASLVEPTVERVRSFDGLAVPCLVYRPRGLAPGARAPAVVMVHGGPEGQAVPRFNPLVQYLVGRGYVVVEPNVRGSTGYGTRYTHLDDVRRREDSVRDLGAVNDWLRAQRDVDAEHIAVMGGSYGGYMTLAAITLQPDRWAAACDIVGIANFRTFLERTAPYRRALREAEYGSLANDAAFLDEVSPIHRVDRIRAPLFVIHGANDPRVPISEAEQIVAALRARNHRVEYLRFENEGHGLARRENRLRAYGALAQFFDELLRPGR